MRKFYFFLLLIFVFTGQNIWSQCTNVSQFGTVTAPTNTSPLTITTCAFAGEYSTINGAVAGSTYLFNATVPLLVLCIFIIIQMQLVVLMAVVIPEQ